jgi:predicted metalloprotease with PDZ domain
VTVRTESGWRITTGMTPGAAAGTYAAGDYHDLVDMPFFVGRFDLDSARIAGKWFRLAWWPVGSLTTARAERTFGWLRRIAPAEAAVFDTIPFRDYTIFMVSDTVVNGGGLEHQSGQMDEVTTDQLDSPGLSGLYAHELFHAWNVKRLRPADMWPYRYDDAQPTRWLWVSEGVTSYYGALAQVRGGIIDSAGFFAAVAGAITYLDLAPPTALGDASLSSWVGPTDGSGGLYYGKGELAGFLLDVMIRNASDGRHSLDDVMRGLYETTYERGRGFTPADWWGAVARAAGTPLRPFEAFARRYVDGREPLPFDSVLPLAGLRLKADSIWEPLLGISTVAESGEAVVTYVTPGGAAATAGIEVGDRLVSVGGVAIVNDASFFAFRQRYTDTNLKSLPAVVRRGGVPSTVQVPVRLYERTEVHIEAVPDAPPRAARIRHDLLTGAVDH